jgi:hypothetical protein
MKCDVDIRKDLYVTYSGGNHHVPSISERTVRDHRSCLPPSGQIVFFAPRSAKYLCSWWIIPLHLSTFKVCGSPENFTTSLDLLLSGLLSAETLGFAEYIYGSFFSGRFLYRCFHGQCLVRLPVLRLREASYTC